MAQLIYNAPQVMSGLDMLGLLASDTVAACFFDPQYSDNLDYLKYGNKEKKRQSRRSELQSMTTADIEAFMAEIGRVLGASRHLFMWLDTYTKINRSVQFAACGGLQIVDEIIWQKLDLAGKPKFGQGYRARKVHETIIVMQKPPMRVKDVWTSRSIPSVWSENVSNRVHPHAKPVGLQTALIKAVTKAGDRVIDPCAGSYSTLTACQSVKNREFVGCDLKAHRFQNRLI